MRKTLFYLFLPAICFILQGCPPPNNSSFGWTDQYSIRFSSIQLKVSEPYSTVDGGWDKLYPKMDEFDNGTIKDFCKVFEPYSHSPSNRGNSEISVTTTVTAYSEGSIFNPINYEGGDNKKTHYGCGNGISSNTINGYHAKNRKLDKQVYDFTIISGPYKRNNDSFREGNLYWTKTIYGTYDGTIQNDIVQFGSFEKTAAFKPIAPKPFISHIYKDGLMVDIKVAMPDDKLVVGNYAEILK